VQGFHEANAVRQAMGQLEKGRWRQKPTTDINSFTLEVFAHPGNLQRKSRPIHFSPAADSRRGAAQFLA
jgi:hypothetical protein